MKHGLKFTPTPQCNVSELKSDVSSFCRKLRLSEKFSDEEGNNDNGERKDYLVFNNSSWNPPKSKDPELEHFINIIKSCPLERDENDKSRQKSNISFKQRKALEKLKLDTSIVIKEADKGGAVVIMDSDYYCTKIEDMLKDTDFYRKLDSDIDSETRKMINKLVGKYSDILHEKEIDYLSSFEHTTSYFYGLPKVHKSDEIINAVREQKSEYVCCNRPADLKFRPIVGGPNSATQRLSHFLDLILKPLCSNVHSYIRDDIDFLHKLPKNVEPTAKLVSFDVTSLYTNIPHELGLEAIKFWLGKSYSLIDDRFNENFIIEALNIILERNTFYFNKIFYNQIRGTAMGTKVAPTYATLVLGYLEETLYSKMKDKYGSSFSEFIKENFKRFLDDCFIIWNKNTSLAEFHDELNSLHSSITFTFESSDEELPFLDVLVKLDNGRISTDIYSKPTDTKSYLEFNSCHPRHTKLNIPYNLASRIVTIVSDPSSREQRLNQLRSYLIQRNYPKSLIDRGILKAREKGPIADKNNNERDLYERSARSIIPFVTTHNPNNTNMFSTFKIHEPILRKSKKMNNILNKNKIINCKRQGKNLKRQLCQSKFDVIIPNFTVSKCGVSRCATCRIIHEGESFKFNNGKTFSVKNNINCRSKNVIYSLICNKCGDFYVGRTTCELRTRMTVHRQQTRNDEVRFLNVNKHFHECSNDTFTVFPLYKLNVNNEQLLNEKESSIIDILKPQLNRSM